MAPSGAKKRLSVLYAQLQGYHGVEQAVPPQRAIAALRQWHESMATLFQGNAARSQRVMGHGVLATFGDPLPLSDHAAKAVFAALTALRQSAELLERWQALGPAGAFVRVGVATGEAITGEVGDPERLDYAVLGPTVLLAEVLMSKAPPGGLLVSEETRRACGGRFEFQAVPSFPLKGHADLFQPYLAVGQRLETDPERHTARLPTRAEVLVRTQAQTVPAWVDNVSAGGMHIRGALALKVGDSIQVEFAPVAELGASAPVIVHGHVRHLRPTEDGSPGLGVLIDRADSADSEALRHFAALYFSTPPTQGEGNLTDAGDFYRLELGEHYLKLIRGVPT